MEGFFTELVWLIPLLPFLAFAVIVLVAYRRPGLSAWIAIAAIALAMVLAWGVTYEGVRLNLSGEKYLRLEEPWLPLWFRSVVLDPLTLAMLLVAGGIFVHHLPLLHERLHVLPGLLADLLVGLVVGMAVAGAVVLLHRFASK